MEKFWQTTRLSDMSKAEWESLCDGCALCCLHKLEDEDTGEVYYTNVSCRELNENSCRCKHYLQRKTLVPECLVLTNDDIESFAWLPTTCAYRLVSEGKDLFAWHPLVSGDANSVHQAGVSVKGKIVQEENVHPDALEDHIITWVNT